MNYEKIYVFNTIKCKVIDIYPSTKWPYNVLSSYPTQGNDLLQIYHRDIVDRYIKQGSWP